ncbi:hypothetical protein GTO27_02855 [Candidatus Bathyarchaeota archaeon]|nr:hypothetical protein [Candidatus Bathyarchaeota archaeon]
MQEYVADSVHVATNIYVEETVYDINFDGRTNVSDITYATQSFGSEVGESSWKFLADVNSDKKVDMRDIASFARRFGETY